MGEPAEELTGVQPSQEPDEDAVRVAAAVSRERGYRLSKRWTHGWSLELDPALAPGLELLECMGFPSAYALHSLQHTGAYGLLARGFDIC